MRLITDLTKKDLAGKKVILRADLDVPMKGGKVADSSRLEASLPSIKFLLAKGAKVTVIGHLGRRGESLKPVEKWLKGKIKSKNFFVAENLRRHNGEEKNDPKFARRLARGFDLYVNDALAASHRSHASIVGAPKLLPAYAGLHLAEELKTLARFNKPKTPLVLIIGGAKFGTKLKLAEKFLPLTQNIFIGGALANLFFKREGYEVGRSFIDPQAPSIAKVLKSGKVVLPSDVVVKRASGTVAIVKPEAVRPGDTVVDVGPQTLVLWSKKMNLARTIIWNGPLGVYEGGFKQGTEDLAKLIVKSQAKVVIGGGDTLAALTLLKAISYKLKANVFLSTGGGATLEFLATGTLPGIEGLKTNKK